MSREPKWIACQATYQTGPYKGRPCSALAAFLVVMGYAAGTCVCGTHARAYTERALQRIEYPR